MVACRSLAVTRHPSSSGRRAPCRAPSPGPLPRSLAPAGRRAQPGGDPVAVPGPFPDRFRPLPRDAPWPAPCPPVPGFGRIPVRAGRPEAPRGPSRLAPRGRPVARASRHGSGIARESGDNATRCMETMRRMGRLCLRLRKGMFTPSRGNPPPRSRGASFFPAQVASSRSCPQIFSSSSAVYHANVINLNQQGERSYQKGDRRWAARSLGKGTGPSSGTARWGACRSGGIGRLGRSQRRPAQNSRSRASGELERE